MHQYNLPWPIESLRDLKETEVIMRVTLSYFVEPGPGEKGYKERYRYASHALRFSLKSPTESEDEFVNRINKFAREEYEQLSTRGPRDKWLIGENTRNVGSIHSDLWKGTATDLASSNIIAVYPAIGWWKERHYLNRWNKACRYALIVSIQTPPETVDIYTEVATQVGISISVNV